MQTLGQTGVNPDRCGRKRRHASQGKAEAAIRSLIRRGLDRPGEGQLVSYRCPRCLSWHVGHSQRALPDTRGKSSGHQWPSPTQSGPASGRWPDGYERPSSAHSRREPRVTRKRAERSVGGAPAT